MRHQGLNLVEYAYLPWMSPANRHQFFEYRNMELLRDLLARGTGALALTLHMGNGDMGLVGLALDGVNALPILEGRAVERPVPLHWQYDVAQGGPWRVAVRRGPWKLLADADRARFALYDVVADAAEAHDRAAEHPEIVDRLKPELERVYVPPSP